MSKTSARHQALQEFLSARGYATIEELARHFEVTPQTVRKDINALAEEGKVQRFHGGAGMVSGSENIVYDERKGICQEEKRRIGALLATHIPDGVSVCINIGTTTEEAARALLEHKNLRVVTNSINVASICARNSSFDVVVACGTVRHRDNGIVGASAERFIREFRVDYGIIGISGIDEEGNLLDYDYREVAVARTIIECSRRVFLVTDRSKFGRPAMHTFPTSTRCSPTALSTRSGRISFTSTVLNCSWSEAIGEAGEPFLGKGPPPFPEAAGAHPSLPMLPFLSCPSSKPGGYPHVGDMNWL